MSETVSAEQLKSSFAQLKTLVSLLDGDMNLLLGGMKAAAPRTRKSLSNVSKQCTLLRAEALKFQKSIPTKSRAKKEEKEAKEEVDDIENIPPPPKLERQAAVPVAEKENTPPPAPKRRSRKPKAV